jgi:hypothetical protein
VKLVKPIEEYIREREFGILSEGVLEALKPVFEQIRRDAVSELEAADFSNYQKVDNAGPFLLQLKLKLVREIEAGLERQITSGKVAERTVKESQRT